MSQEIKQRIEKLKELIHYHNKKYFIDNEPEISDEEFDQLMIELIKLENQYPEYKTPDSPTQMVGSSYKTNTFEPVVHKVPMLSLEKVHDLDEFKKWSYSKVKEEVFEFFIELKLDGLAVDLEYKNGKLVRGATRGDGQIGEDVTATIFAIKSIPKEIIHEIYGPFTGHIRGEVYLKKSNLNKINEIRKSKGLKLFSNVRNTAAGLLRRKEVASENYYLDFAAYGIETNLSNFKLDKYSSTMELLKELKVPTVFELSSIIINVNNYNDSIKQFEQFLNKINNLRNELDFDIDGLVIKANKFEDQSRLGEKVDSPNWAVAYKFPSQSKMTKVLSIEFTMGNKGNITPNARIEPVEIMGTVIRNVTLHNIEELKRLDLKINDTVIVSKRGDVIPKIEKVVKELRTGNEIDIEIPSKCPSCFSPTIIQGAYLRCSAGDNCTYMTFAKIENFVKALEIEEFGPKIIEKLIDAGYVKNIIDIYNLTIEQLMNIERMGERSATKLYNNIQKSKNAPYYKVLMGLTIPKVGPQTAKLLINKYGDLKNLLDAKMKNNLSELTQIEGIGSIVSQCISEWFDKKENIDTILNLIDYGIGKAEEVNTNSGVLKGKSFCFTGKLTKSRSYYENLVKENGGVLSSVKKGLDYLVVGEKAGSKLEKAKKLNVNIINESEFMKLLENK